MTERYAGRVFFVTGTDTGVGKTRVAEGLLAAGARAGLRTLGIKPVAAGIDGERGGNPYNVDARALQAAATLDVDYAAVNPILLRRPIAPHIAAAEEGIDIRVSALAAHCRSLLTADVDLAVIEGAGGWLVPLNDQETLADFCVVLGLPVILVVGMRLGCLNHALLTAAAIRGVGLELAGWVANCVESDMIELDANIETLRRQLSAPCLGRVPHLAPGSGPDDVAEHLHLARLIDD